MLLNASKHLGTISWSLFDGVSKMIFIPFIVFSKTLLKGIGINHNMYGFGTTFSSLNFAAHMLA